MSQSTAPSLRQLQALASKTARWAKREASRQHDMANFEVDSEDLTGMCAMASVQAFEWLARSGVANMQLAVSTRFLTSSHVFLLVDGWRVDPTATQFGADGPVVELHTTKNAPWYYKKPQVFSTIESFFDYLDSANWDHYQHPRRRTLIEDAPSINSAPCLGQEAYC